MTAATTKVSVRHLYKVFGEDPESVLGFAQDGMSKTQLLSEHGHVLGLRDINIDIKSGEVTVIMGLSGSGKSTLIRHLNRLIEPTSGNIQVDGEEVMEFNIQDLRKLRQEKMSMVFQTFALLPHRTVIENAAMPLLVTGSSEDEAREEAGKWLERVGLDGFENHQPSQLSGGMQQRVGLARALASSCDIMLMDEAFCALDPLIRTNMQDLLIELQQDLHKTIVFITHDLDESLKLADHLVILKDGDIIQQGEPQHILLNPNDPYIEDFVSDINRARVLRTRSVMLPLAEEDKVPETSGRIDYNDTLESVITESGGEIDKSYLVTKDEKPVGFLDMKELVKALVPRNAQASEVEAGKRVSA